ncbi:MAG: acetolactate synthase small subunit [Candidatus Hydrogenedentota bacterium]|nr:MAG: acetolactate synthase small subunit [Candidatus Hydrogenedentota bacterium]
MKHILSVTVNNSFGVLSHVAGLFTRRGYNIDSLSVGETQDPTKSVITLVVNEDPKKMGQVIKQLYKLTDVIDVKNLTGEESLKRELILVTVNCPRDKRHEILNLVDVFRAQIVDMAPDAILIEMIGIPRRVSTFLHALAEYGIKNIARTGSIALPFPSIEWEQSQG